jgi:hypothetical protein
MSIKSWLGIDAVSVLIQAGITVCVMFVVGVADGPEELFPLIMAGSIAVFGIRRWLALRNPPHLDSGAERMAEVEDRLGALEAMQERVLELEERLDFAERLLTRQQNERLPS